MPKKTPDSPLSKQVAKELHDLQTHLCDAFNDHCSDLDSGPVLGVFRLFPDVDMTAWEDLVKTHNLNAWLTLPVNGETYPHLKQLQETLERLSYQTEHDALTGLANRRAFDRVLDMELERSRRGHSSLSLALVDLDDFKKVNDSFGHATGDMVLSRLANMLTHARRRYDLSARVGGEEFAVVLPGTGQSRAKKVLQRVLDELRDETFIAADGQKFNVTTSMGLATTKGGVKLSPREFYELADKALYKAKQSGKDRIECAPLPEAVSFNRRALVQANEKRFLFGK